MRAGLVVLSSYGVGCIVGAYYIVRFRTGRDVRLSGSGNAGARNVFRSGDTVSAILTFLWDAAKGMLVVWVADRLLATDWAGGAAFLGVLAGHIWPAQLGFRGGKGVVTAIGCTLALALIGRSWPNILAATIAWTIVAIAHRPVFDRHRRSLGGLATPTRENAP
jgi:glycerol-3-phosphate acyltransferase PlsY